MSDLVGHGGGEGSQISRVRGFSLDLGGFFQKLGNIDPIRTNTEVQGQILVEQRAHRSLIKVWSMSLSLLVNGGMDG